MKIAFFSTILLSLSTMRVAAIPSALSKDTKADEHTTTQLVSRSTNGVAAAHLDPISASVVFSLVTSGIALAVSFMAKQLGDAKQARERAAKQGVVITYSNGETIADMMGRYLDNFRNDHPEYLGVLLVTDSTIEGTPTLDYTMVAVEFVDLHDPEVAKSTYCVTIVSKSAGSLVVHGLNTLWMARGSIFIEFGHYDPNVIAPHDEVKFTFHV